MKLPRHGFRITLLSLVALGWLAFTATAQAKEQLSVVVGDWPPFISQDQKHHGFIAHLIKDVFADEGYQVEFHFHPWNRAYLEAAQGRHHATAVWMHQSDREEDFLFSQPVLDEQFVFFYRQEDSFDWDSIDDLAGLRVGGGDSYSYGPVFDAAAEEGLFTLERVRSTDINLLRLLAGRIDVFPEERSVGLHAMRRTLDDEQRTAIAYHPQPLLENQSFVLFPRASENSEALKAAFNERLQKYRENGRYETYFYNFAQGYYESANQ